MALRNAMCCFLAAAALFLCLFGGKEIGFALEESYCRGEKFGWVDVDEQIDYSRESDGFDGFLKEIVDEKNGCIYLYFHIYDTRIEKCDDKSIALIFTIKNSENEYRLAMNKNGLISGDTYGEKSFNIDCNFDEFHCSRFGGEIFAAIEFKDKSDRGLTNYISCDYAPGAFKALPLFENRGYDFYTEPEKQGNNVVTTKKGLEDTSKKSGTTNGASEPTTKFRASGNNMRSGEQNVSGITQAEVNTEIHPENANKQSATLSTSSRLMMLFGGALSLTGLTLLIIAFTNKRVDL